MVIIDKFSDFDLKRTILYSLRDFYMVVIPLK